MCQVWYLVIIVRDLYILSSSSSTPHINDKEMNVIWCVGRNGAVNCRIARTPKHVRAPHFDKQNVSISGPYIHMSIYISLLTTVTSKWQRTHSAKWRWWTQTIDMVCWFCWWYRICSSVLGRRVFVRAWAIGAACATQLEMARFVWRTDGNERRRWNDTMIHRTVTIRLLSNVAAVSFWSMDKVMAMNEHLRVVSSFVRIDWKGSR